MKSNSLWLEQRAARPRKALPSRTGGRLLRDAIVKRHAADFGSNYNREECIASTGGKLALFNAIQVLVDHGDEVILPIPYWVSFKDIIQYAGGTPIFVESEESNGFQLTPEMIEQAITPRTKALILNSPSNPSGAVVKPEDMRAIAQLCHERGIYVIARMNVARTGKGDLWQHGLRSRIGGGHRLVAAHAGL